MSKKCLTEKLYLIHDPNFLRDCLQKYLDVLRTGKLSDASKSEEFRIPWEKQRVKELIGDLEEKGMDLNWVR